MWENVETDLGPAQYLSIGRYHFKSIYSILEKLTVTSKARFDTYMLYSVKIIL